MKRKIIASILATTILATCAFTAVACSKDEDKPNNEANVGFEQTMVGGGMQIGESKGNGIQLMSTTLLASEYSDYGVAATAESAYTLSATITPSDAANHGVDWTLSWSNPSSSWASGFGFSAGFSAAGSAPSRITGVPGFAQGQSRTSTHSLPDSSV